MRDAVGIGQTHKQDTGTKYLTDIQPNSRIL
jgi:hypothetical protein